MKKFETLHDELYRTTYQYPLMGEPIRPLLVDSRKFVLDDEMSAFLADLGYNVWLSATNKNDNEFLQKAIEDLRKHSYVPFKKTWIEWNDMIRWNRIVKEYRPEQSHMTGTGCEKRGFLIEQYNESPVYRAHLAIYQGEKTSILPFAFAWSVDGSPIPWKSVDKMTFDFGARNTDHMFATLGIKLQNDWATPHVKLVYSDTQFAKDLENAKPFETELLQAAETVMMKSHGILRTLWTLFITINQTPTLLKDVKRSKGFFAKGKSRKFLDYTTLSIKIPKHKKLKVLAKAIVELSRKRRHEVRGHFRLMMVEGVKTRVWIKPHERGDATLGWVTHKYSIEKNVNV